MIHGEDKYLSLILASNCVNIHVSGDVLIRRSSTLKTASR